MTSEEAFHFWFALNGKTIGTDCTLTAVPSLNSSVTHEFIVKNVRTGKTCPVVQFVVDSAAFFIIPESAMTVGGHKMIYAFHKDGNRLLSRYFWMSQSEGSWRSGTGYRRDLKFRKGHEDDYPGAYTFETQLHPELEKKLVEIYGADKKAKTAYKSINNLATDTSLKKFLILEDPDMRIIGSMIAEYEKEVRFVDVLDKTIHDSFPLKSMEVGAVELQRHARLQKGTDGKDHSVLKAFKEPTSVLWQLIVGCLKTPVKKKYVFTSDLLESDVNVESFELKKDNKAVKENIIVEMAYTAKSFNMEFKNKLQTITYHINSPICWVKSVYIDEGVSSFGNYKKFPADLCFLPQKPMDYYMTKRQEAATNHKTQISHHMVERQNIAPRGTDTYRFLALFDEKYSPLVQKFKESKKFSAFTTSLKKVYFEEYLGKLKDPDFVNELNYKILESCHNYIVYNRQNPSMAHGSTGRQRVFAFFDAIDKCKTYEAMGQVSYDLFARNTVGDKCFTGFFGGGKIATRASSYIVYFCDALYETIVANMPDHIAELPMDKTDKLLKGAAHTITRAAFYMKKNHMPPHCTNSGMLEKVIEAMKG